ncbi:MAG: hypothetical protein ACJ74W_08375 [Pyrinomonadaceae bacterium]
MEDRQLIAFVLMPFDAKFGDIYNIGIKEAASQVGIAANRLDEQLFTEGMMDRIYRQIDAADIIIADMSGQNPNVFYEVGYAHAKDKFCILLTRDTKDIPFDLKHRRHIEYGDSISHLRQELVKNLQWAKNEIEQVRKSQIRVELKPPEGSLTTTSSKATATVHFRLNLFNDNNKPSSEISTVYFYAGHNWHVEQDSKECSQIESDIPEYRYRYFLVPPIARLPPKSWAQLKFIATRIVANKYAGDQIEYSYRLTGRVQFRFITSDGVFDFQHSINVEADDIPF